MSGRSHRFLGITSTFWEVNASCSRTLHGDQSEDRTPDLSLRSPTLYHKEAVIRSIHDHIYKGTILTNVKGRIMAEVVAVLCVEISRYPNYLQQRTVAHHGSSAPIMLHQTPTGIKCLLLVDSIFISLNRLIRQDCRHMLKQTTFNILAPLVSTELH